MADGVSAFHRSSEEKSKYKIEKARQRWKLLSDALQQKKWEDNSKVSRIRFLSFGLLHKKEINKDDNSPATWYEYTSSIVPNFKALIRHLSGSITPNDLIGFNNTGNLCVWPSEEVLAYYCLKNMDIFRNKSICEIGGGMTCLAGIFVALVADAQEVMLTDGNKLSVSNVHKIIEANKASLNHTKVTTRILRWDFESDSDDIESRFDYILCSDCLFFNEGRNLLAKTIVKILKPKGQAIILAPSRANTFLQFQNIAQTLCTVRKIENYDPVVWNLHNKLKTEDPDIYQEDLHYPVLLEMSKEFSNNISNSCIS